MADSGAELPHVFIPSRGRAALRAGTWHLLMEDSISFTIVVEPREAADYAKALATIWNDLCDAALSRESAGGDSDGLDDDTIFCRDQPPYTVSVLPESNRGVAFVRNHILHELAPPTGWFWIMDDDIKHFLAAANNSTTRVSARWILTEAAQRMLLTRGLSNVGIFALEYQQFAFSYGADAIAINSYCNIAICLNRSRLPPTLRYRFRVREDFDLVLQAIAYGAVAIRFRNLGFAVPSMGAHSGGMLEYYRQQMNRDIREQNRIFLATWGPGITDEVHRGQTKTTARFDIRVRWGKLQDPRVARAVITESGGPRAGQLPDGVDPLQTSLNLPQPKGREPINLSEERVLVTTRKSGTRKSEPLATSEPRATDVMDESPTKADTGTAGPSAAAGGAKRPRGPEFEYEYHRELTDASVLEAAGLVELKKPRVGTEVVFIPQKDSQPFLARGLIMSVNKRRASEKRQTCTVAVEGIDDTWVADRFFEPVADDEAFDSALALLKDCFESNCEILPPSWEKSSEAGKDE